jgi:hypothetical protein
MKTYSLVKLFVLFGVGLAIAGCGGGGSAGGSGGTSASGGISASGPDYFPITVGSRWTYQQTTAGTTGMASFRVTGTRTVSNQDLFVFRTDDASGTSEQLLQKTATEIIQVPGAAADAATAAIGPVTLLRQPVVAGDSYVLIDKNLSGLIDFDGDGKPDVWIVRADATVVSFESVTTPAGLLTGVAHVRTIATQSVTGSHTGQTLVVTTTSDDWYASNIGPVKNTTFTSSPSAGYSASSQLTVMAYSVGGLHSETVAPTVVSVTPTEGSVGLSSVVSVQFSEVMDQFAGGDYGLSLTSPGGAPVTGLVLWQDDHTLIFAAQGTLPSGVYTGHLTTTAQDLAGNQLAASKAWSFTIDRTGPMVISRYPPDQAIEVPLNSSMTITFDEDINPVDVTNANFVLSDQLDAINYPATVSLSGRTVTLTPNAPLERRKVYRLHFGTVHDGLGNMSYGTESFFTADSGRFGEPEPLNVFSPAIADLNGNGRADLATIAYAVGSNITQLFVQYQQADGTLAAPILVPTNLGCYMNSVVAGDVDVDGYQDLVVGSACGAEVLRQTSSGTLSSSAVLLGADGSNARPIQIAADGRPGIMSSSFSGLTLWRQTAPGIFAAPARWLPTEMSTIEGMAIADFNGDGRPDVVVTGGMAANFQMGVLVLYQQGDGSFTSQIVVPGNQSYIISGVAAGDLNGDGRPDIVVSAHSYAAPIVGYALGLLQQNADGTFAALQTMAATDHAVDILVADLNGDGRLDVIVGYPSTLGIYMQRSDGTLDPEELFDTIGAPKPEVALAVGDLTGDGLVDIVATNSLLRQRPQPALAMQVKLRQTIPLPEVIGHIVVPKRLPLSPLSR